MGKQRKTDEPAEQAPATTVAEHIAQGTWQELLQRLQDRVEELSARVDALEARAGGA